MLKTKRKCVGSRISLFIRLLIIYSKIKSPFNIIQNDEHTLSNILSLTVTPRKTKRDRSDTLSILYVPSLSLYLYKLQFLRFFKANALLSFIHPFLFPPRFVVTWACETRQVGLRYFMQRGAGGCIAVNPFRVKYVFVVERKRSWARVASFLKRPSIFLAVLVWRMVRLALF